MSSLVLTLFIALINLAISTPTYTNETDMHALLAFKSMLQDPLGALNSWNNSVHFCSWQGISCGRRHRRVTALNLNASGLVGPLSPYIGNLSFIREMTIFNNSVQAEIPPQIGRLFRLKVLQLPYNSLEGKILTNLSQLSSLEVLNLRYNKLEGGIPRELGGLPKLWGVSLSNNNLSGEIPCSIGNLTSLQMLYIRWNGLVGSIPDIFGQLQNLTNIGLGYNNLSEYGIGGEVSMKGDVYSYGILLLEMITERSPIDPMFADGLSLHNYALNALPGRVLEIVKPKLLINHGEEVLPIASNNNRSGEESRKCNHMIECLVSLIKIGVSCSLDTPQDRMNLTDVICELYSVRRILEELEA